MIGASLVLGLWAAAHTSPYVNPALAVTDIRNVSIYIRFMDKIQQILVFEINNRKWEDGGVGVGGGGGELLISEITGSVLDYPVTHTKYAMLVFITSRISFEYHGI